MIRQLLKLGELLPRILRGEFRIDPERGVVEYQGMRIVSIPAATLVDLADSVRELVGEGVYVVLAGLGRSLARSMKKALGDVSLERIVEVAKLAGFGRAELSGGSLVIEELPVDAPQYVEYVARGFFEELLGRPVPVECSAGRCVVKLAD